MENTIDNKKETVTITKKEYDDLQYYRKHFDPVPWCSLGICEGVSNHCHEDCPASLKVITERETAQDINKKFCELVNNFNKWLDDKYNLPIFDKESIKYQSNRRDLKEMPCDIGDIVYFSVYNAKNHKIRIESEEIIELIITKKGIKGRTASVYGYINGRGPLFTNESDALIFFSEIMRPYKDNPDEYILIDDE